jgi:glycosyltransferase involved in cell wall biosynthesis
LIVRLVVDLIGAQTERSSIRGIGRYTRELARSLAQFRQPAIDLRFTVSGNFPERSEDLRRLLAPYVSPDAISSYWTPPAPGDALDQTAPARRIGEAIVRRHIAGLRPDVYLASSLYEIAREDFAPFDLTRMPAGLSTCIAYDFIPLIYRKAYLKYSEYRRFYLEQTAVTASADLLFAISECSRRDAIDFLGIEPDRVVNISAAADDSFRPRAFSPAEIERRLKQLGLRAPFIFCATGADARKNPDVAFDAFLRMSAEDRRGAQLAMLVPLDRATQDRFRARAERAGVRANDIVFLDRIEDDDLAFLYQTAEIFVFPSLYEGFGLPLLEAMQCGGAVIAGDNSSLREIANRPDVLCDTRSPAPVAEALTRALRDADWRADIRAWGLKRSADFSWRSTAQRLQDALVDRSPDVVSATRRGRETSACLALAEGLEAEIGRIRAADPDDTVSAQMAAECIVKSAPWLYDRSRHRLLIDVTQIATRDSRTGIQRVVRNVVQSLYRAGDRGITPVAVRLEGGQLVACQKFVAGMLGAQTTIPDAPLDLGPGDTLLMLDNSWGQFDAFVPLFDAVRRAGGRIVTCVYDLIPEAYRAASIDPVPAIYSHWLRAALLRSDAIITISRTVADELVRLIREKSLPHRPGLAVGWFHCGSDLDLIEADTRRAPGRRFEQAFPKQGPTFLVVGTLEPRKGHRIALDAFDRLWKAGSEAKLVFIGRRGWNVEAIADRIARHPALGRTLFWFENASDDDLAYAYEACSALVFPSYVEGFGLPLVEAARAGRPVICSDIPVFREVGQDGAVYFRANDPDDLAKAVRGWIEGSRHADPENILRCSWADSAQQIAELVLHGNWPIRLTDPA